MQDQIQQESFREQEYRYYMQDATLKQQVNGAQTVEDVKAILMRMLNKD